MKLLENFLARTTVVDELVADLDHDILDYIDVDLAGGGSCCCCHDEEWKIHQREWLELRILRFDWRDLGREIEERVQRKR